MYPDNLRYTKEHEWVKTSGDEATIGVTFFAQKELGDVVYVELPEVGRKLKAGEEFGTIESVKAVSELYAPVSGEVVAANEALADKPEIVNEDSYDRGWMIRIKVDNPSEVESLMDVAAYKNLIGDSGS
jgi:glycine cleavage system H protein